MDKNASQDKLENKNMRRDENRMENIDMDNRSLGEVGCMQVEKICTLDHITHHYHSGGWRKDSNMIVNRWWNGFEERIEKSRV